MDIKSVFVIARREVRDSLTNRWFLLFAGGFALLALLLQFAAFSKGLVGVEGHGYGRTAASLINLVIMFVPLISLIMGAITVAGEREKGTLAYLLSHPVTKAEIFFGKFIGLMLPIAVSILLGFGVSGFVVSVGGEAGGGSAWNYLSAVALSLYLAASLCGIGLLISVLTERVSKAIGVALFIWLMIVVFGDLGIIGTTLALGLGIRELFFLVLINPAEVFKIAAVLSITNRIEVLGPVGIYALRTYGQTGTLSILLAALSFWFLAPLGAAFLSFCVWRKEP